VKAKTLVLDFDWGGLIPIALLVALAIFSAM
jgi:hypothetical protein